MVAPEKARGGGECWRDSALPLGHATLPLAGPCVLSLRRAPACCAGGAPPLLRVPRAPGVLSARAIRCAGCERAGCADGADGALGAPGAAAAARRAGSIVGRSPAQESALCTLALGALKGLSGILSLAPTAGLEDARSAAQGSGGTGRAAAFWAADASLGQASVLKCHWAQQHSSRVLEFSPTGAGGSRGRLRAWCSGMVRCAFLPPCADCLDRHPVPAPPGCSGALAWRSACSQPCSVCRWWLLPNRPPQTP